MTEQSIAYIYMGFMWCYIIGIGLFLRGCLFDYHMPRVGAYSRGAVAVVIE